MRRGSDRDDGATARGGDMNGKEFWSYLMDDGRVYPLGFFDADFDKAWPDVWAQAEALAKAYNLEPVYAFNEDDLTEVSTMLHRCYNVKKNLMGEADYLVGTFVSESEEPLLRELHEQYPDCEFLNMLVSDYEYAKRSTMKKVFAPNHEGEVQ
jgi:hypothetical protein